MSLNRRNVIALFLILIAAVSWTFGQLLLNNQAGEATSETTEPPNTTVATIYPTSIPVTEPVEGGNTEIGTVPSMPSEDVEETDNRAERLIGFILSFASVASSCVAIFALSQKNPLLGPDGTSLIFALLATVYYISQSIDYILFSSAATTLRVIFNSLTAFAFLTGLRELFGWIRARFSLSWCLVHRAVQRCTTPQMSLLFFAGWISLALVGATYFLASKVPYRSNVICIFSLLTAGTFGILCLWKYGTDLNHFRKQLNNYQNGKPITVGDGAFAQTEAQLLDVQAQHEEAVRTAVTSERFKVELISNVSHDLRTPLTSILGYSELLQNEALSPDGKEQLRRLHQKAGYMNELVESLFELTKVSSGVVESKKEQIDLVRLLEQTIGLFDDQLVSACLTVKRSYCADTIPAISDGARMHQVFANLLGNAIKYALAGTRIYLDVRETDESFLIRMMNTASYEMDFNPDEIMQRFARGDKARSTRGSGLGLAIAQTYTESVGGSFRVGVDGDQFSAIVELPKTERIL